MNTNAKKLLILFSMVIICSQILACQNKPSDKYFSKTPEDAINSYIESYRKGNFENICQLDSEIYKSISSRVQAAPKPLQQQEYEKALGEEIKTLNALEQNKLHNRVTLINSLNLIQHGGGSLFRILFPNISFKILEVRDSTGFIAQAEGYSKEGFIEITFSDFNFAPYEDALGNKKIQRAVIKVLLDSWQTDKGILYRVRHYEPTEYSKEYFSVPIAIIGKYKITENDFWKSFDKTCRFYRELYRNTFSKELENKLDLKRQVLDSMINEKVALLAAENIGINVSESDLEYAVKHEPSFLRNGQFDEQIYMNQLKLHRISTVEYYNLKRDELIVSKLRAKEGNNFESFIESYKRNVQTSTNPSLLGNATCF